MQLSKTMIFARGAPASLCATFLWFSSCAPLVAQSPLPAGREDSNSLNSDSELDSNSGPADAAPIEGLRYYVERNVSGPDGDYLVAGGVAAGYLMDSRKRSLVQKFAAYHRNRRDHRDHEAKRGLDVDRLIIVLYDAYNSQLLRADGEDADLGTGEVQHLTRYLHQECYDKIDYDLDDVFQKRRANVDCYVDRVAAQLNGDTLGFRAYLIWGTRLEDIRYWDPFVVPALTVTLLGLTLPPMALFLALVGMLRSEIRHRVLGQRLVKVLAPLGIGLGWFIFWLYLSVIPGGFPGVLNSMKAWFWLSGIFFALNFIACMWVADHIFFPENHPPPLWVVALFYLFGPFLLVLGGAAGSAAGQGAAAAASGGAAGSSSSSSGGAGGGRIAGGGGSFGGGGASGSF